VGFSLGEILLLVVVGIIVVGPKRLPAVMRTAGQWIARLRRMTTDLRSQSGIDDLLRQEGLEQHLHEIRSLSRLNVVDSLMAPAAAAAIPRIPPKPAPTAMDFAAPVRIRNYTQREPEREREYPHAGCDSYGALADDAVLYHPSADEAPPHVAPTEAAPIEAAPTEAAAPAAPAAPAQDPA
jgi:sec-independent protein translocase protein TatB